MDIRVSLRPRYDFNYITSAFVVRYDATDRRAVFQNRQEEVSQIESIVNENGVSQRSCIKAQFLNHS